ncbi:uncharacterized protein H6S33_002010 [Morchella sextelata]|uniref:uncharacterized protein n=1 Tax=Morchella sextelata TaxID=1174677 RepID=UPI001D053BB7|nr:uncharacterized protein H6S33_002010 [Morchella sextelata]KAH0607958.1 hypothetical protein H6S33_002010 [Morchella sextelata]
MPNFNGKKLKAAVCQDVTIEYPWVHSHRNSESFCARAAIPNTIHHSSTYNWHQAAKIYAQESLRSYIQYFNLTIVHGLFLWGVSYLPWVYYILLYHTGLGVRTHTSQSLNGYIACKKALRTSEDNQIQGHIKAILGGESDGGRDERIGAASIGITDLIGIYTRTFKCADGLAYINSYTCG